MDAETEKISFAIQLQEAILKQQNGERKSYDFFLSVLRDGKFDSKVRIAYIEGFRSCVHLLNKDQETLVGVMLKMEWCNCGEDVVDSYIHFLTDLVSAHTFYLRSCLKMLVQKFTPERMPTADLNDVKMEDFADQFENVHKALIAIINIVPTAPRHLLLKLCDMFPYIGKHQFYLQCYTNNLLYITKYMPTLQEKIFAIIIDNLLKIDVHIIKCEIEEELNCDSDEDQDETLFSVEIDNENLKNIEQDPKRDKNEMQNEHARKLDNLMLNLFEFIGNNCFCEERVDWEKTEALYNDLTRVFEVVLLPTHASAYVQFIIFYICSFDQYLVNSFLEFCWQKVCDPNVAVIIRQTAAAYIGSIVARAKFIPGDVVRTFLLLFTDWIHSYLSVLDGGAYPDLHKHNTFYSVCQTLLYVFVFRHKIILAEPNCRNFLRKLNFERIVSSKLNPLRFCLSTVVDMFARITRMHEIVFCYTIIEHNKRNYASMVAGGDALDKKNMLDSFFPFDPYLLKKSSKFIKPIYQEWSGIEGEPDLMDEDEAGKDEDEAGKDDNGNEDIVKDIKMDALSYSISPGTPRFDWCISPGFHPELIKNPPIYEAD